MNDAMPPNAKSGSPKTASASKMVSYDAIRHHRPFSQTASCDFSPCCPEATDAVYLVAAIQMGLAWRRSGKRHCIIWGLQYLSGGNHRQPAARPPARTQHTNHEIYTLRCRTAVRPHNRTKTQINKDNIFITIIHYNICVFALHINGNLCII